MKIEFQIDTEIRSGVAYVSDKTEWPFVQILDQIFLYKEWLSEYCKDMHDELIKEYGDYEGVILQDFQTYNDVKPNPEDCYITVLCSRWSLQ